MADRPIIFSAPMVRALLEGRKTQTRRLLRIPPPFAPDDDITVEVATGSIAPRFAAGDRLWVRENFRVAAWRDDGRIAVDYQASPEVTRSPWCRPEDEVFRRLVTVSQEEAKAAAQERRGSCREADGRYAWDRGHSPCRWRPSIHMPRQASRITLMVSEVRVQRLQDLTLTDMLSEGIVPANSSLSVDEAHTAWLGLWNSLHGPGAWDANPWVAGISFSVLQQNIDSVPAVMEIAVAEQQECGPSGSSP